MAKRDYREKFILERPPADLGEALYSLGGVAAAPKGAKKSDEKSKKLFGVLTTVWLVSVTAILTVWFLYTVIFAFYHNSALWVLKEYAKDFVALLIIIFMTVMICGRFFVKIFRFIVRKISGEPAEISVPPTEPETAEIIYSPEISDGLDIYENFVCILKKGERVVVARSGIIRAFVGKDGKMRKLVLESARGDRVWIKITAGDVRGLKKYFPRLTVEKVRKEKDDSELKKRSKIFRNINTEKVAGLVFGLIALGAGGGVIAMHFVVAESIPVFLGAFFIMGGILLLLSMLAEKKLVTNFFVPLLFGIMFAVFSPLIAQAVAEGNGMYTAWTSAHEFFCSFSGLYAVAGYLMAISLILVGVAVSNLIKYIRK